MAPRACLLAVLLICGLVAQSRASSNGLDGDRSRRQDRRGGFRYQRAPGGFPLPPPRSPIDSFSPLFPDSADGSLDAQSEAEAAIAAAASRRGGGAGGAGGLLLGTPGFGYSLGATFPPAVGFAPATCSGTPFCVPQLIPPTFAPAIPVCPAGYSLDPTGICSRQTLVCPPGAEPLGGKCCTQVPTNVCWASLEPGCPGGCNSLGPICAPAKDYLDVLGHVKVQAVAAATAKERAGAAAGAAFFELILPKLDLVKNAIIQGVAAAIEKKVVSVPLAVLGKGKGAVDKAVVAPKCFSKCCKTIPDTVCAEPRVSVDTCAPSIACGPGCAPAGDKCVCSPGGPAPCPPGTRECAWSAGRMCVALDLCFGIDQCTMVNILLQAKQLRALACPVPPGAMPVGAPGFGKAAAAAAAAAASGGGKFGK